VNVLIEGLFVRKLEAKTESAWIFRRARNAYDGIVPLRSQVVSSADVDIFRLSSIVDWDFDDRWLVIGEYDLIGIVRIDLELIVVNDLEIESAYTVRDQVVGGSEDDMLIDIGEVEEKPTACQTFCLIVDEFFESELDDPVVDNIHVETASGALVVFVVVVVLLEAILTSPIRVLP
jgi:hypothetical protein